MLTVSNLLCGYASIVYSTRGDFDTAAVLLGVAMIVDTLALPMLLVPGFLMVSTIRFRSVKAIDVGWRRSPVWLLLGAVVIAAIAAHPRIALVVLSYTYVTAALLMFLYGRLRRRPAA